ncbi:hypothetical protein DT076_16700 [Desertihabitans brevis]|uniref:DUF1376 domain-containing protein n=1 Tax=Desertihabitans brevis TaxID=2268447 RepID=A0A367YQW7_9ACTN|nr:hypothetical protein [Desertihabitans brevis]RCK68286.1 hypothetical protein DT076_16700 [Desertihabitans brevis]
MSRRIPREFVPLDQNYLRDPAIRRAGPDAELLYLRALAHAKAGGTDGFIGDYDLPVVAVAIKVRNPTSLADALVREGLWVAVAGGWRIRSWTKWNMTEAEKEIERQKKRDAAILTNHRRYHSEGKTEPGCPHCPPRLGVAS